MKHNTYICTLAIQYSNKRLHRGQYFDMVHVCFFIKWAMMHVSQMVMNIACMECSNLSRWDFFYRTLCMLHDTRKKAEHSVTL